MIGAAIAKSKQLTRKHLLRQRVARGLFYAQGRANIGDSMVPWLVEKVAGHHIPFSNPRETRGPHLFSIGSILQTADSSSTVWGSGFIQKGSVIHGLPAYVAAVRGPLSAIRLQQLGGPEVKRYGDPAIISPLLLPLTGGTLKYRLGLVPHYVDKDVVRSSSVGLRDDVRVCDVETDSVEAFVRSLLECEVIASSSLHGVILAESYGVPAVWIQMSKKVVGHGFKFHDYYLSTGRQVEPLAADDVEVSTILKRIPPPPIGLRQMAEDLIEAFPHEF